MRNYRKVSVSIVTRGCVPKVVCVCWECRSAVQRLRIQRFDSWAWLAFGRANRLRRRPPKCSLGNAVMAREVGDNINLNIYEYHIRLPPLHPTHFLVYVNYSAMGSNLLAIINCRFFWPSCMNKRKGLSTVRVFFIVFNQLYQIFVQYPKHSGALFALTH